MSRQYWLSRKTGHPVEMVTACTYWRVCSAVSLIKLVCCLGHQEACIDEAAQSGDQEFKSWQFWVKRSNSIGVKAAAMEMVEKDGVSISVAKSRLQWWRWYARRDEALVASFNTFLGILWFPLFFHTPLCVASMSSGL